jgi:TRAP-type mannitol/chloroaromatic compound transport system substrate-binding protein
MAVFPQQYAANNDREKKMERRKFLQSAGIGLAAASAAAPVLAQGTPEFKWRLSSSIPKSLDTAFGPADLISKRVAAATGGKFQIQVFAAGEIVPGAGLLDAVKDNTVQLGHGPSYYWVGKDPSFSFDSGMPFGLNARQHTGWLYEGGGMPLLREFFKEYNVYNIPCGNTGAQMGGWYRKEIKSVEDLKGLKFRIGGIAGMVMSKLGVVPQQISPGDIYPALEKGTIDAAEFIGPYDDEKLGFNRVAKYYYYPAWWEGGAQQSIFVNLNEWAKLPKEYQIILEDACAFAHHDMVAKYDTKNPQAMKRLIGGGTQLRPFPNDVLAASYKACMELYEEIGAKNPRFKKILDAYMKYRDDVVPWFAVAEGRYDSFMASVVRSERQAKK